MNKNETKCYNNNYYKRNRENIKRRNLARYYERKMNKPPVTKGTTEAKPTRINTVPVLKVGETKTVELHTDKNIPLLCKFTVKAINCSCGETTIRSIPDWMTDWHCTRCRQKIKL